MQYYVEKDRLHAIIRQDGRTVSDFLKSVAPIPVALENIIKEGGPARDAVLIGELENLFQTSSSNFVLLKKEPFDGLELQSRHAHDPLDYDISHFERDMREERLQRAFAFKTQEELSPQERKALDEELQLRKLSMDAALQEYRRNPSSFDSKTQEELLKWENISKKDAAAEPAN